MTTNRPEMTDQELWRSLAADRGGVAGAVSDTDLAAWLEGRSSEADAGRIDAAIATDPALRAAALELSEILGQPLPAAPERLVVRARALVGFDAEHAAPRGSFLSSLMGWRFGIQRAAMASLAVLIAITGFMMGGGLGSSYAQDRQGKTADRLSELSDIFSNDGSL
jgi:anti-sigma factor RsiW